MANKFVKGDKVLVSNHGDRKYMGEVVAYDYAQEGYTGPYFVGNLEDEQLPHDWHGGWCYEFELEKANG